MVSYLISTKSSGVFFTLYLGGIISYNMFTIFSNGCEQLMEYRKTKQSFNNEIESIIVGIQKKWIDNLFLSMFWPLRLPFQLVPMVILSLNPEKKEIINYKREVINYKKEENTKPNNSNGKIINKPIKIVNKTEEIINFKTHDVNYKSQDVNSKSEQTQTENEVNKLGFKLGEEHQNKPEQNENNSEENENNSEENVNYKSRYINKTESHTSDNFNFGEQHISFDFSKLN